MCIKSLSVVLFFILCFYTLLILVCYKKNKNIVHFYFDMQNKNLKFVAQFHAEAIIYIMEVGVGAFLHISVYIAL